MLISVSELISQSWGFYFNWKNFKKFMPYIGIMLLVGIGIFLIPAALILLALFIKSSVTIVVWILAILAIIAAICFSIYWGLWIQVAYFKALKNILENKPAGIKQMLKESKERILPYFGTSILMTLLVLAGFFLFIIPGIILMVWFSFSHLVTIYEAPKEGAAAIRESKKLIAGRGGKIFWRFFVPWFIFLIAIGIISYLVSLPFGGAESRVMVTDPNDPFAAFSSGYSSDIGTTKELVINLTSNLLAFVFSPLLNVIGIILYKSAKENPISQK